MARLNGVPVSSNTTSTSTDDRSPSTAVAVESPRTLKRRYAAQNYYLAKRCADQSKAIQNLQEELSALRSTNASLGVELAAARRAARAAASSVREARVEAREGFAERPRKRSRRSTMLPTLVPDDTRDDVGIEDEADTARSTALLAGITTSRGTARSWDTLDAGWQLADINEDRAASPTDTGAERQHEHAAPRHEESEVDTETEPAPDAQAPPSSLTEALFSPSLPALTTPSPIPHDGPQTFISPDTGRPSRGGRARPRVSYAEPKLNTKMRRPSAALTDAVVAGAGRRHSVTMAEVDASPVMVPGAGTGVVSPSPAAGGVAGLAQKRSAAAAGLAVFRDVDAGAGEPVRSPTKLVEKRAGENLPVRERAVTGTGKAKRRRSELVGMSVGVVDGSEGKERGERPGKLKDVKARRRSVALEAL